MCIIGWQQGKQFGQTLVPKFEFTGPELDKFFPKNLAARVVVITTLSVAYLWMPPGHNFGAKMDTWGTILGAKMVILGFHIARIGQVTGLLACIQSVIVNSCQLLFTATTLVVLYHKDWNGSGQLLDNTG